MAGRPVRSVLMDALLNLSKDDLNRFTEELWIREEETRIPRGKVEGKGYRDVANVMVSTFKEENAVNVAVEIMNSIGCSDEADKLVKKTSGQTLQSASTDVKETGGQTSQSASTDVKETGGQTSQSASTDAVLMKMGFPVKTKCNVLMYYKPNTRFLKLHVYVIPLDPALQQKVDKEESCSGYKKIIKKPHPDMYLQMQQSFTLTADIDTAEIHPKEITLRYNNQDPNFYEVFIENPDREFNLTLSTYSKKSEAVWTCEIRKDDHPTSGPVEAAGSSSGSTGVNAVADGKHFVDKHRGELIKRVSNIDPILDDLLEEEVITQEAYTDIRVIATHQKQMRALYEGPLKAGKKSMDTFYQILQKHEKYLIEDLQGKK